MTLIVGIVGTDGVILAADRNAVEFARNENEMDNVMGVRKIIHLDRHRVAYAFAGDYSLCNAIGQELSSSLDSGNFGTSNICVSLEQVLFHGYGNWIGQFTMPVNSDGPVPQFILVVFYGLENQEIQLWRCVAKNGLYSAMRVGGLAMIGGKGNTARFFASYNSEARIIRELTFLGAHIVLTGHRVDGLIDGLDIATFDKHGYHWIDGEEKNALRLRSAALNESIRNQLFS